MADPNTPGNQTSEHDSMQKAKIWIRFAAGLLVAIAAGLLATGVIPTESAWVSILAMVVSVGGLIAGETKLSSDYGKGRALVKAAKARGETTPDPTLP